jgi:peptidoglycan/LPS O-acetylase OafA/YrhL
MLRVITAIGVVAVHVLAFTVIYNTSPVGALIQHGVEATMHFTREVFMFTTALVLVYTYIGKRFDLKTFARKRGIGVVLPYVIWSLIYILLAPHPAALPQLVHLTARGLVTGEAAVQLYYILLTIQFYILFPVLLVCLPILDRHRRLVLGVSAALELAMLAVDYFIVQTGPVARTPIGAWMNQYGDRIALVYQFYFVLGALCALHLDRLRALALRHARLIGATMGGMLLVFWGYYAYMVGVAHGGVDRATAVQQPIMVPYSLAVIAFLWWVGCRWASSGRARNDAKSPSGQPPGSRLWRTLADASFGIYLVHPLFITFAMGAVARSVPTIVPEPLRVALVWAVAVAGSLALSVALMKTPILSRLVGRDVPLPEAVQQRLRALAGGLSVRARRTSREIQAWTARSRSRWRRAYRTHPKYATSRRVRAIPLNGMLNGAPEIDGPSQVERRMRVGRLDQPEYSNGVETECAARGGG